MIYKQQKSNKNEVIKIRSKDEEKIKSKEQGKFMRILSKSRMPKQIIDFVFGQDQVSISENLSSNQLYLDFPLGGLNNSLPIKPSESSIDFSSKQSKASINNCTTKQQDSFENFPFFKVNKSSKKNHKDISSLQMKNETAFLPYHLPEGQIRRNLKPRSIEQAKDQYKKLKEDCGWDSTIKLKSQLHRGKKEYSSNDQATTAQSLNSNTIETIFSSQERKQNGKNETKKISQFILCDENYSALSIAERNKDCNQKHNQKPNRSIQTNPTLSFEKMDNSLCILQKNVQEMENTIKSIYNSTDLTQKQHLFVKDSLQDKINFNERKHQLGKQKLTPQVQNEQIELFPTNQENNNEAKVFTSFNQQDYSKNMEPVQSKKKLLDSLEVIQMKMFDTFDIQSINDSTQKTENDYRNFQDESQHSYLKQDPLKEQKYGINDKLPFSFLNNQKIDYSGTQLNSNILLQRNQAIFVEIATGTDTELIQSTNQQNLEHNSKQNTNFAQEPKQSLLIGKRASLEMASGVVLVYFENTHKQRKDDNRLARNAPSKVTDQIYPDYKDSKCDVGQLLNYEMYKTFKQKNLTKKRTNLHLDKYSGKVIELPYIQNPCNAVVVDGKTFPKFIKSKVYYFKG